MDAYVGLRKKRQLAPTPPNLSAPEHLVSPKAAPVRRLPIGAEPQRRRRAFPCLDAARPRGYRGDRRSRAGRAAIRARGYFSLWSQPGRVGMRYRFRLDQGEIALPDPASRFQPEGPSHGPSEIVDPGDFAWTDGPWRGVAREHLVIYEMSCPHLHRGGELGCCSGRASGSHRVRYHLPHARGGIHRCLAQGIPQ
jgi:hypothetical protein